MPIVLSAQAFDEDASPTVEYRVAVTVELRGEADVRHDLAERDAQALIDYLAWQGVIAGKPAALPPAPRLAPPAWRR